MRGKKREGIFLALSAVILAAAVVFVFVGSRSVAPITDHYTFQIPVTYEEHGQRKTVTLEYCGSYVKSEDSWSGYYADNGMSDSVMVDSDEKGGWAFVLELEGGYLMGDERYADFYADGFPEPTLTYYDEEWVEYTGVTQAPSLGIKLIGCEYPQPIENAFVDSGVEWDMATSAVLTAFAAAILLLGVILVKKKEGVVYRKRDREARLINVLMLAVCVPLLLVMGPEWEVIPADGISNVLAALQAPVAVLGVCASVLLRRKGWSRLGMAVQFVGPAVFMGLIFANLLIGFGFYSLFVAGGILLGAAIAVFSRGEEGIQPNLLDRVCVVSNLVLVPVYLFLSMPLLLVGSVVGTGTDAGIFWNIIAVLLSVLICAAPLGCGFALGQSVALRKRGKSIPAFLVQFGGFAAFGVAVLLTLICDMLPMINSSIN